MFSRVLVVSLAVAILGGVGPAAQAQVAAPIGVSASPQSSPAPEAVEVERVQAFDTLDVSVLQLPELNRTVEVNSVGVISLPLGGDFNVAGRTTMEIAADITERLGRHDLQKPQVTVSLKDPSQSTVSLKDAARRGFTVEGSVIQPGVYSVYGPTTLLQGLALAHGIDQYANEKRVTIFRDFQGRTQNAIYNLADIRNGKALDPQIYPKDTIVVAGSRTKRFIRDVAPILPLVYLFPHL